MLNKIWKILNSDARLACKVFTHNNRANNISLKALPWAYTKALRAGRNPWPRPAVQWLSSAASATIESEPQKVVPLTSRQGGPKQAQNSNVLNPKLSRNFPRSKFRTCFIHWNFDIWYCL